MLKKVNRLTTAVLVSSKTSSSQYFSIKSSKNNLSVSRFAFVVSKKIDKRATARNSLKRKLRSSVEEIFDKIEVGNDFVFYPKHSLANAKREQVLDEVKKAFLKEGYLKDD